jgi:uncharacterized SAM-binding protein YcdF (DUF218 family)
LAPEEPTTTAEEAPQRGLSRSARWLPLALLGVFLLLPATALLAVYRTAQMSDREHTDAIVVLGAAQFQGKPSPVLAARLKHAADLFAQGIAPRIITVGGNRPGDITTEAAAGRRVLIKAGVPADSVIAVPEGADTLTSVNAVADKMAALGLHSATFVSDPAHMARVSSMAGANGIHVYVNPTKSGAASQLTRNYVVREVGGVLKFWLFDQWSVG